MEESSQQVVVRLAKKKLKRVLGVRELFAVGYGDVGSSIYYALGATALFALGATPLALLIAGGAFLCTALSYAELAATFPEPGGAATFSRYAFNDLISFIAGWGLLLDYIITLAISAFTIPPYLKHALQFFHIPIATDAVSHITTTVLIIFFLFGINYVGIKFSGWFSFLLAAFTFLTQAFIVIVGALFFLNIPFLLEHIRIGGGGGAPDWWQFFKGTAVAMVAYTGIEALAQLAAEAKRPGITIPRAIKWTVAVVLFLYVGISSVGLSVISPLELGSKYIEDPVVGIVLQFPVAGALLAPWVGAIAAVILLIAANAGLIGCSRLTFSMGEYYQVPQFLFRIHPRFRTPHVALAVFTVLASIIVIVSRNQMIFFVDLYNFGAQIAFLSAHCSLLILRIKQPSLHRPYSAPLNIPIGKSRSLPLTAIFGALISFAVWCIVVITKPEGRTLGFAWLAIGCAMYFYYRRKRGIAVTGRVKLETIAVPEYRQMHLRHILVVARSVGGTEELQVAFQLAKQHNAEVTALAVLEVPYAAPLNTPMREREKWCNEALTQAEAIANEYHLSLHRELIRARSVEEALLDMADEGHYDLMIVGVEQRGAGGGVMQSERLFQDLSCKVIFYKPNYAPS